MKKTMAYVGLVCAGLMVSGCGVSKKQTMKDALRLVREAQKLECNTLRLYLKQAEGLLAQEVE